MLSTTLALVASLILVLANCFFVASEFALVKVRPTRLATLAAHGNRRARIALKISRRLDVYLSASQLGITLASLGLGWLGEPAFAHIIEPWVQGFGAWSGIAAHTIAAAMALVVITLLHVVLGELVPKSLALQLAEPVALWTAAPLRAFYIVAFPLIWVFNSISQLVLRVLQLRAPTEAERLHSPEELRLVLAHVSLDPRARSLIDRVFDYTQRNARQIMTLRRDVVVLRVERSFEENLETAMEHQFTRYPLVDADDRVEGYVHIKDVTAVLAKSRRHILTTEITREPVYANENIGLEDLRRAFQSRGVHLAIIRNNDKKFVGIVTLEDLLEEFVGEIRDEQDITEVPPIVRRESGAFEVDGRLTLDVARRELGLQLDNVPADVETLGEFVLRSLSPPAACGDAVEAGGYTLTVLAIRDRRVSRVRGEVREQRDEPGGA